ncbi:glycoside hydrolase family 13 protein [Clostridium sp. 'White wine YQ']|uniref:glycoside hydrolase family 13 protein n=1 Tax=Clostridium sp. 'White wine YQ' TaxID=3027474 RepID=UPI0023655D77|nr:glycoside hydrolase family 13 protein [Clostridium sp. 'White wine YQ']MDD7796427.1 glycoside hydrolase family 13 protein [Clostridium sp. 'White wine YQ']
MSTQYIYHDSQNNCYRKPFGAVPINSEVFLLLETTNDAKEAFLELINFDGTTEKIKMNSSIENFNDKKKYYTKITLKEQGVYQYYFSVVFDYSVYFYGNNIQQLGGEGESYSDNPKTYQITVYKDNKIPAWFKEGIIYQIFVDRFFNGNDYGIISNPKKNSFLYGRWDDDPMYIRDAKGDITRWDFFGGNLKGVIRKMPYLKDLGINAIYFNPIFEATSNHKYDTGDYKKIDEMYGDESIFAELCRKAADNGIKIILDGVFSHTGADSIYFNKYGNYSSLGAYQSKYSKYYNWYSFKSFPDSYDSWWGFSNLPNVNELYPDYIDYVVNSKDSVLSKWMNIGVSGWRLDVADELPDEFIRILKERVRKEKLDSVVIGEVWEDASNKISYGNKRRYFLGDELDSVTNYPLRENIIEFFTDRISSDVFNKRIMSLKENYPVENFYSLMNLLGTHDTKRILTEVKEKKILYLCVIIQMTMVGVPLIYYGDEVGLKGEEDPLNRKTYPWGKEDTDILNFYKKIIKIRNGSSILKCGDLEFVTCDADVICYIRGLAEEKLFIIVNRNNNESKKIFINELVGEKRVVDLLTCKNIKADDGIVRINPLEGLILRIKG